MNNLRKKIKPTLNRVLSFFLLTASAILVFFLSFSLMLYAEEPDPIPADEQLPVLPQEPDPIPANEQLPALPQSLVADKSFYNSSEIIKISNASPGSAIEIYWLDNPETAENPDPDSRPSNVYGIMVGDDGVVNIEAATLPPGDFVLVNTFEPGHCNGFYLSQCRARSDYLGEVLITILAP